MSLSLALAGLAVLAGTRAEISTGVGAGYNPFELPSSIAGATAPEPGTFFPFHAWVDARGTQGRVRYGVRAWGDADLYAWVAQDPATAPDRTRATDASHGSGAVGAPLSWVPVDAASRTLTLTIEPFAGMHREVFTSPVTGRPYVASGISYARRFDTNHAGARASTELALGETLDAYAAVSASRVDYVDDFRGLPGVDSWDYTALRADVDTYWYPSWGELAAAYSFERRGYDARFPHDAAGNAVLPGSPGYAPQVFYLHDATIKAGLDGDLGRLVGRFDLERRVDAWGGYLDYTDAGVSVEARGERGPWTLSVVPSFSVRVYDYAHVNYDPIEPTNRRSTVAISSTLERDLGGVTSCWVEAAWTSQHSSNALYTFQSAFVATGVKLSFR